MPGKCEVRLLRAAEDDLSEAIIYIAQDNPVAAERLLAHIEKNLENLASYPHSGTAPQEPVIAAAGFRYLVVDNYLVFYIVEDDVVFVHRIIHGARDYRRIS